MCGPVATWTTADGTLTLAVFADGEDSILGFPAYPWHTHGSLLADAERTGASGAVGRLVEAVLTNQIPLTLVYRDGELQDVQINQDADADAGDLPDGIAIRIRNWST